nr:ABC transporter ATP-binding protein [uncultured Rhodoferax sp.]
MTQQPVLPLAMAASALNVQFGSQAVLRDLQWQLPRGQVVGLLGRNGAGKTTLLETLLGLRQPTSGSVQLFGQDCSRLDDATRARIGYVPQQSDLFENFTARQLLQYFQSFYPRWNATKVDALMARWELPWDKTIAKLSGGQQQRLSIVRALAHEPDLLVLDEPVSSLDPAGRRDFLRELVDQVLDRGTTVIFSTHILSDLERVAFQVAFMREGRIVLQDALDALLEHVQCIRGGAADLRVWHRQAGGEILRQRKLEGSTEQWLVRHARTAEATGLATTPANLEELFMELTQ